MLLRISKASRLKSPNAVMRKHLYRKALLGTDMHMCRESAFGNSLEQNRHSAYGPFQGIQPAAAGMTASSELGSV